MEAAPYLSMAVLCRELSIGAEEVNCLGVSGDALIPVHGGRLTRLLVFTLSPEGFAGECRIAIRWVAPDGRVANVADESHSFEMLDPPRGFRERLALPVIGSGFYRLELWVQGRLAMRSLLQIEDFSPESEPTQ